MKRKTISKILLFTILIVGAFIWVFPLYWIVRTAFMDSFQILDYPPVFLPKPIIFSNFSDALRVLPFGRFYLNTIIIVIACSSGTIFTSSLCAYSFSRLRWPGRDKVFGLLLTGMMLPTAVTLIPTFIGWSVVKGVNTFLPLTVPAWFGGGIFHIFLLRQFYLTIPREYDEAAHIDGAGYFAVYWRILLPMIKPALISVLLFSFINAWNDFLHPLVYLSSESKFTLSLGLRVFMGMYNSEWHYMMAATTMVVIPVIIVFFLGQKYIVEGIVMSGLKA
jgi:multiple sugar transport system permease protein